MAEENENKSSGSFNFRGVRDLSLNGHESAPEQAPEQESPDTLAPEDASTVEIFPEPAPEPQDNAPSEEPSEVAAVEEHTPPEPVSQRLEAIQKSASEVRRQLAEARKQLSKQRAQNIALQDQIAKLQEDLRSAEAEKEFSNNQLLEMQQRLADALAEDENRNAQLLQLQEHYERLQVENQAQFEELDRLRAEAMQREQSYRKQISAAVEKSAIKTSLLIKALRLLSSDPDIADNSIPEELLNPDENDRVNDLQQQIAQLQQQVEYERERTEQLESMLRDGTDSSSSKTVISLLIAILIGIILTLILVLTRSATAGDTPTAPTATTAASIHSENLKDPEIQLKTRPIATDQSKIDNRDDSSLDLPPDSTTMAISRPQPVPDWPKLNLPNARISHNNKIMRILFSYGLFYKSTAMTPQAKIDLANLAEQLCSQSANFTIIIEGHADPLPISNPGDEHADNYALGMDRANAIKEYLEKRCNFPRGIIETVSAGDSNPPFPNNIPESRRKNRTAVIYLKPGRSQPPPAQG